MTPEEYKEFLSLGHGEIFNLDLDRVVDAPWRLPGIDISDFFNYGMNHRAWKEYCQQIQQYREEFSMQVGVGGLVVDRRWGRNRERGVRFFKTRAQARCFFCCTLFSTAISIVSTHRRHPLLRAQNRIQTLDQTRAGDRKSEQRQPEVPARRGPNGLPAPSDDASYANTTTSERAAVGRD